MSTIELNKEIYGDDLPSEYYEKGLSDRRPFEDRAEMFAELSIPYVFRDKGASGSDDLRDKYAQSLVADLVNNLSSKITLTLFPPSASGFRLSPSSSELEEITGGDEETLSMVRELLSGGADLINREIEAQDIRKDVFGLLEYQIIVGSCIMEKVPKKGIRLHGLKNIVVTLDDKGEAIKMCVYEELNRLPDGIDENLVEKKPLEDKYGLYTMATWVKEKSKWFVVQEIDGTIVSEITYSEKNFPFSYQGMIWTIGDKYSRPFIEKFIGDISSYDKLSKLLVNGSLIAAKTVLFVDERQGRTRKRDVANSNNGDVVDGRADDVTALTIGKNYDFQIPFQIYQSIANRLEKGFLAKDSIVRQAERVTAEEIREMAQELEGNLAGEYATISNRITKRIVTWIMNELKLDLSSIDVEIITGLNALGKSNEIVKLDNFISRLAQLEKLSWVKDKELIDRYAEGYGVNTNNLIKGVEEYNQEMKAMQEQMAMSQLEGAAAQSVGQAAGQALIQGG